METNNFEILRPQRGTQVYISYNFLLWELPILMEGSATITVLQR